MKRADLVMLGMLLTVFVLSILGENREANERATKVTSEYPKLPQDYLLQGKITAIEFQDRNNRFSPRYACLTIAYSNKYQITVSPELKSGFALMDLLKVGMYFTKLPGNDTIELRLDSANQYPQYRFVLKR